MKVDIKSKIINKLESGARIKIIGDSLTAGQGASDSFATEELVLATEEKDYYRLSGRKSWAAKLKNYLKENYPKSTLINNGCGGIKSSGIRYNFDKLYSKDDDIVILLMGANDRKQINGMELLKDNLSYIIDYLINEGKEVIVLSTIPSTKENEAYPNRIYHMDDVHEVVLDVVKDRKVFYIDLYDFINEYLDKNNISIEELMTEENCMSDGLHPTDRVHSLMYAYIIEKLFK